ncbi:Retrovirus-related Pol polyprotein from transposon 17.6 [Cucumis melo var. makuwa]|uniref:Retrovirus-related Pol polyprotein from transposon 17.6 n=1 Tax=Cucumis melo var. makuwa TaxID=1194695 RepID=A0A5D3CKB6_CUCMM|nr:Retrovirus-related Pol polyprotein from transposon 17.6 [Cucumis melo var. makuwa]
MVKKEIVLGHKISNAGLEVDPAKIDVVSKLSPPPDIKPLRSKTLNEAQENYTTIKKELFAVVFAIEKFKSYIVGFKVTMQGTLWSNVIGARGQGICLIAMKCPEQPILEIELFNVWGIYFIGPFPRSGGHIYILLVIDYVLNWVEVISCTKNDVITVKPFVVKQIFLHGAVEITSLDRTNVFKKPRLKGSGKKISIKPRIQEFSSHSHFIRPDLEQGFDEVDDDQPKYKNVKHGMASSKKQDYHEVVAEEFSQEIERMSPLKPRLRPEELGLISVVQPKKGKNKTGALRHLGRLLNLLYEPIKALKSEKIFMGETKMRNLKGIKPFPTTVEKLCLKYLPTLARYPQIDMVGEPKNTMLFNLDLRLVVYDQLLQDIHVDLDTGKTSSVRGEQSENEAPTKNECEFCELLHNVIIESMDAALKEVLLENLAMKEQIASLNTKLHYIAKRHDRQFATQMEYTHALFVQLVAQPVIIPELVAPTPPIQLTNPTPDELDPCPES